nr:LysR substrate-binding domain-containing protein [Vibrio sinus]
MYYFYVAAEQGSLKLAAEKLFVTPAAISQQIRQLEQWLETELFFRQHRKIVLTDEGVVLFDQAAKGFAHLHEGVRLISSDPNPTQLTVSALPSFSQHWLIPRLGSFRAKNPEISLLLEPTNELVSYPSSTVDLCIRYGHGQYPKVETHLIMEDALFAVCHPIYQKTHQIYDFEDLPRAELIEDMWPDLNWQEFLHSVGQSGGHSTLQYSGSHMVLDGALAVQGVALVRHSLSARYLSEGKLVIIGNIALRPKFRYYLCAPASYFKRQKVQQFKHWIEEEIQQFRQQYPLEIEIRDTDFASSKCSKQ